MCHKSIYLYIYTIDGYLDWFYCELSCNEQGLARFKRRNTHGRWICEYHIAILQSEKCKSKFSETPYSSSKDNYDKDKTNPSKHLEEKRPPQAVSGTTNQGSTDNSVEIPQNSKSKSCQVTRLSHVPSSILGNQVSPVVLQLPWQTQGSPFL